jgi:putative PIN family toxin of toxin-antitoxin system
MKVVIDTNVFISSFFGGNPRKIIDLWKKEKITLCLSKDILAEYIEVLGRIGLKHEQELQELLSLFAKSFNLLFISKTPQIKAVKAHPGDDKFIECAVALNADFIITGDKALAAVREYMGIKILTPQQFLKEISGESERNKFFPWFQQAEDDHLL